MTDYLAACAVVAAGLCFSGTARAAAPGQAASTTAAPATARQIGTILAIEASSLTLTTDKGATIAVGLNGETKVVQLPAGSTDLKAAQPATMTDVVVGDRVLALGAASDSGQLLAKRLVLMKQTDIAHRHESEEAGWQHGSGGIVSAVDAATGMVTIASGARTITITTTPATIIRRYAPSSARFEDATRSKLAELHPGDQLRVRGERAADGSIKADEIVSGSFRHLSGTIESLNVSAGEIVLKDAKTQKPVTLAVTAGTAIHELPPETAARFAARAKAPGGPSARTSTTAPAAGTPVATPGETSAPHSGGAELSQVVARLPALPLANLKAGQAVMVVGGDGAAGAISAITILSGVEPILAASPAGGAEMALSPWSMGGGGEAGGSSQ